MSRRDGCQRWTVPLGGRVDEIFHVRKLPAHPQPSAYYNVERPDDAASWQIRAQMQSMFPKATAWSTYRE